jgi:hypothetical protein
MEVAIDLLSVALRPSFNNQAEPRPGEFLFFEWSKKNGESERME